METNDRGKRRTPNLAKYGEESLLKGLSVRSTITDCPLGAFKVIVTKCSGEGECASVCVVNVFRSGSRGECVVTNGALCFGCMACVAQCTENGVLVVQNETPEDLTLEDLLK